jgi:hypothetical protein
MIELALQSGDLKAGAKLLEISAKWLYPNEMTYIYETQQTSSLQNFWSNCLYYIRKMDILFMSLGKTS